MSTRKNKTIGIVGGVGPSAGVDLMQNIIDNTPAGKDQDHLDTLLFSLPRLIPDRSEYLLGQVEESPALGIFTVIGKLHDAGAGIVGIPCNTAHTSRIFNPIKDAVNRSYPGLDLVDMIVETRRTIENDYSHIKTLGLLATMGTYVSDVYKEKCAGDSFQILYPKQLERVHESIYHPEYGIKSNTTIDPRATAILKEESQCLIEAGSQALILGCTEIPLGLNEHDLPVPVINPTLILARALIAHAMAPTL